MAVAAHPKGMVSHEGYFPQKLWRLEGRSGARRRAHRESRSLRKDINPDYVIPMHCSGVNMIMAVQTARPKTLVMPSPGARVVFGA